MRFRPTTKGVFAGLVLLSVFFIILIIFNSVEHVIDQFLLYWYYILILSLGFGLQVGLYSYSRQELKNKNLGAEKTSLMASGGLSGGSMVACCLHHLTDVLPILGISALSIFLIKYQVAFFLIGIASNLIGLSLILYIMQKHNIFTNNKVLIKLFTTFSMKKVLNYSIVVLVIIVVTFAVNIIFFNKDNVLVIAQSDRDKSMENTNKNSQLETKYNSENNLTIDVTPLDFSFDQPIKFEIGLNTHQGDLDANLTIKTILEDSQGNIYEPLNWEGDEPGGHHRSGVLNFPKLAGESDSLKLIINDLYDVPERVFLWQL